MIVYRVRLYTVCAYELLLLLVYIIVRSGCCCGGPRIGLSLLRLGERRLLEQVGGVGGRGGQPFATEQAITQLKQILTLTQTRTQPRTQTLSDPKP